MPLLAVFKHRGSLNGGGLFSPDIQFGHGQRRIGAYIQSRRFISYYDRLNILQHNLIFDMFQEMMPIMPNPAMFTEMTVVVEKNSKCLQFIDLLHSYWDVGRGFTKNDREKSDATFHTLVVESVVAKISVSPSTLPVLLVDAHGPNPLRRDDGMMFDYRVLMQRLLSQTGRVPLLMVFFDHQSQVCVAASFAPHRTSEPQGKLDTGWTRVGFFSSVRAFPDSAAPIRHEDVHSVGHLQRPPAQLSVRSPHGSITLNFIPQNVSPPGR